MEDTVSCRDENRSGLSHWPDIGFFWNYSPWKIIPKQIPKIKFWITISINIKLQIMQHYCNNLTEKSRKDCAIFIIYFVPCLLFILK